MKQKTQDRLAASGAALGRMSAWVAIIVAVLALAYVLGMLVFGYYQYGKVRQLVLRYGMGRAGADLAGVVALLFALSWLVPAWLRLFFNRASLRDGLVILVLPLFAYGLTWLPVYFDASSGQALRYCAERPGGDLFCLDHAGVDPQTGRPLVLMNPRTAELQYKRSKNLRPRLITRGVDGVEFFDGLDGRPRVYFASDGSGCYRIYDQPGMDPQTGQPLAPATVDLVQRLRQCRSSAAAPPVPRPAAPATSAAPATPAATAARPSFDCAKASWQSERMVCASPRLAALDVAMARAYHAATARSPGTAAILRDAQNYWLRNERERCANTSCLQQVYEARIRFLEGYR